MDGNARRSADGMRVIDCTIRNMSDTGARLLIANTVGVPETFHLFEKSSTTAPTVATSVCASSTTRRKPWPPALRPHQQMRPLSQPRKHSG